jgi:hypothetical protein
MWFCSPAATARPAVRCVHRVVRSNRTSQCGSEAFSNIVLGYINPMLIVEDIDDKFEHCLEHPVLLDALLAVLLATSSLSHLQEYVSTACSLD